MRSAQILITKVELLEDRRLFAVPTVTAPDQGIDVQILSDVQNDTTPGISESVDPVKRVAMPGGFRWFDATPEQTLINNGGNLDYILVNGWNVWQLDNQGNAMRGGDPYEPNVRLLAHEAAAVTDTLVIDVEEWQMDIRTASQAVVNQNIARFQNIISWIREEQPNLKVGIYSIFPVSDQYATVQYTDYLENAVDPVTGFWYRWAAPAASNQFAFLQNSDAYLSGLAESVDYIFPALYTSSPDQTLWRRYAEGSISNARRYGKPVIPFLMPTYHHASGNNSAVVPAEMWQFQLDYMTQMADSAIIWSDPYVPTGSSEYWITMAINAINGPGARPALSGADRDVSIDLVNRTHSLLTEKDDSDTFSGKLIADFI